MKVELDPDHAHVVTQAVAAGGAASESAFIASLIDHYREQQTRQSEIDGILLQALDGAYRTYESADALREDLLARFDARHRNKTA